MTECYNTFEERVEILCGQDLGAMERRGRKEAGEEAESRALCQNSIWTLSFRQWGHQTFGTAGHPGSSGGWGRGVRRKTDREGCMRAVSHRNQNLRDWTTEGRGGTSRMLSLFLAWKSRWVLRVSLCPLQRHVEVLTLCLGICVNVTLFENRIAADVIRLR